MDDKDFLKEENEIERLSSIIKSMKHIRLCFIDLIDQGAKVTRDNYSVKIEVSIDKPKDYKLLAEYYQKLSIIYDSIIESIDKVNLEFKPVSESVISEDNKITVEIVVYKRAVTKKYYDCDYDPMNIRIAQHPSYLGRQTSFFQLSTHLGTLNTSR